MKKRLFCVLFVVLLVLPVLCSAAENQVTALKTTAVAMETAATTGVATPVDTGATNTNKEATSVSTVPKQETYTEELLFMEIPKVVTASKKEEKISEASQVITVITADEIKQYGARNINDILEWVVGVYETGSYMLVNNKTSIRGDFLSHVDNSVLILINGRPVREAMAGGWNYPVYGAFPVDMISRIEVVRGPGSVLYGTNAMLGVINIITKKGGDKVEGKLAEGGGSFNAKTGSLSYGGSVGDLKAYGAVQYFGQDGWKFKAVDMTNKSGQVNIKESYQGVAINLEYNGITFNGFQAKADQWHMGILPMWIYAGQMNADKLFGDLGYKYNFSQDWYATANLTCNYDYSEFDPDPQPLHKAYDILGEVNLFGNITDNLNFILGGTADDRLNPDNGDIISGSGGSLYGLRTYSVGSFDQKNYSAYLEGNYKPVDFAKLTAGGQWNYTYTKKSDFVPRAGMVLTLPYNFGAKLLYGEAFRSPWPIETIVHHSVLGGNSDLKSEKVKTSSAELLYQDKSLSLGVTGFYTTYSDFITTIPSGLPIGIPPAKVYVNKGSMISKGMEFEGKWAILSNLNLTGSYSYQTNKSSDGIVDFTEIPNNMYKLGVAYNPVAGISIGVFDSYYTQPNPVIDIKPTVLVANPDASAYNWMTAKLSLDLSTLFNYFKDRHFTMDIYGDNLLDQSIYYPENASRYINSIPGRPGRAVYADVSVQF
jgi:outer membrane receptor for ferrienterochelin and colicins